MKIYCDSRKRFNSDVEYLASLAGKDIWVLTVKWHTPIWVNIIDVDEQHEWCTCDEIRVTPEHRYRYVDRRNNQCYRLNIYSIVHPLEAMTEDELYEYLRKHRQD